MRRKMLALALAASLATTGASFSGGGSISGGGVGSNERLNPDAFVSFAASPLFGTSATVYDYASRITIPKLLGVPRSPASYGTQETSMIDDVCSADETTQNALKTLMNAAGDDTAIWLPADCKILWFLTPTAGQNIEYTISSARDDLALVCANPATCGFEFRFRAYDSGQSGQRPWNYAVDDVFTRSGVSGGGALQGIGFRVGTEGISQIGADCSWTGGYALGTKKIQLGCSIATSGGNEWGPGDVVRLTMPPGLSGSGSDDADYLTRVACVRNSSNVQSPAVDPGGLCDQLDGANQIQIEDGLPMDYRPGVPFPGAAGLGANFTYCSPCSPDTFQTGVYVDLSGHIVEQVERVGSARCGLVADGVCGNGTATDNMAENVVFWKVGWSVVPEYIGSSFVYVRDAMETRFYRNHFKGNVGGNSHVTLGTAGGEAGRTQFMANTFEGGPFNTKCYGEVLGTTLTNPVGVEVRVFDSADCSFSNDDDWVAFTADVADPLLAGRMFRKLPGTFTAGSPNYRTITITGLNGSDMDGLGRDAVDTPGGLAVHVDGYAMAGIYLKSGSSGTQVVSNYFKNTTQTVIAQSGSMGGVFLANYERSPDFRNGRGLPFFHGNSWGSGFVIAMNDVDSAFVPLETSNRAPTDNGEGGYHLFFKNRCVATATPDWPLGPDQSDGGYFGGTRGLCIAVNEANQYGAVNEGWNFLGNVGNTIINSSAKIDELSNNPSDFPAVNAAPHLTYRLAWHRNRSATGNNDDNFDGNGTTSTDVLTSENDESATVPAAYADEEGMEPTGPWPKPSWWDCTGGAGGSSSMGYGRMGAWHDDMSSPSTLSKLPIQILIEGGTCPGLP